MYLTFFLMVKVTCHPVGKETFFELADFSNVYFPADWYVVYDKLGNGCNIVFPVRSESKLHTVGSRQQHRVCCWRSSAAWSHHCSSPRL